MYTSYVRTWRRRGRVLSVIYASFPASVSPISEPCVFPQKVGRRLVEIANLLFSREKNSFQVPQSDLHVSLFLIEQVQHYVHHRIPHFQRPRLQSPGIIEFRKKRNKEMKIKLV